MFKRNRRRFFIDFKVQGALLVRATTSWFFCLLSVTTMLLVWGVITGPTQAFVTHLADFWQRFAPALVASILLLPLVLMDTTRMSNRFAGPIFRLRGAMKSLARGESVRPVHFREHDFWKDMAEDFNAIAAKIPSRNATVAATDQNSDQELVAGV